MMLIDKNGIPKKHPIPIIVIDPKAFQNGILIWYHLYSDDEDYLFDDCNMSNSEDYYSFESKDY